MHEKNGEQYYDSGEELVNSLVDKASEAAQNDPGNPRVAAALGALTDLQEQITTTALDGTE